MASLSLPRSAGCGAGGMYWERVQARSAAELWLEAVLPAERLLFLLNFFFSQPVFSVRYKFLLFLDAQRTPLVWTVLLWV